MFLKFIAFIIFVIGFGVLITNPKCDDPKCKWCHPSQVQQTENSEDNDGYTYFDALQPLYEWDGRVAGLDENYTCKCFHHNKYQFKDSNGYPIFGKHRPLCPLYHLTDKTMSHKVVLPVEYSSSIDDIKEMDNDGHTLVGAYLDPNELHVVVMYQDFNHPENKWSIDGNSTPADCLIEDNKCNDSHKECQDAQPEAEQPKTVEQPQEVEKPQEQAEKPQSENSVNKEVTEKTPEPEQKTEVKQEESQSIAPVEQPKEEKSEETKNEETNTKKKSKEKAEKKEQVRKISAKGVKQILIVWLIMLVTLILSLVYNVHKAD